MMWLCQIKFVIVNSWTRHLLLIVYQIIFLYIYMLMMVFFANNYFL